MGGSKEGESEKSIEPPKKDSKSELLDFLQRTPGRRAPSSGKAETPTDQLTGKTKDEGNEKAMEELTGEAEKAKDQESDEVEKPKDQLSGIAQKPKVQLTGRAEGSALFTARRTRPQKRWKKLTIREAIESSKEQDRISRKRKYLTMKKRKRLPFEPKSTAPVHPKHSVTMNLSLLSRASWASKDNDGDDDAEKKLEDGSEKTIADLISDAANKPGLSLKRTRANESPGEPTRDLSPGETNVVEEDPEIDDLFQEMKRSIIKDSDEEEMKTRSDPTTKAEEDGKWYITRQSNLFAGGRNPVMERLQRNSGPSLTRTSKGTISESPSAKSPAGNDEDNGTAPTDASSTTARHPRKAPEQRQDGGDMDYSYFYRVYGQRQRAMKAKEEKLREMMEMQQSAPVIHPDGDDDDDDDDKKQSIKDLAGIFLVMAMDRPGIRQVEGERRRLGSGNEDAVDYNDNM